MRQTVTLLLLLAVGACGSTAQPGQDGGGGIERGRIRRGSGRRRARRRKRRWGRWRLRAESGLVSRLRARYRRVLRGRLPRLRLPTSRRGERRRCIGCRWCGRRQRGRWRARWWRRNGWRGCNLSVGAHALLALRERAVVLWRRLLRIGRVVRHERCDPNLSVWHRTDVHHEPDQRSMLGAQPEPDLVRSVLLYRELLLAGGCSAAADRFDAVEDPGLRSPSSSAKRPGAGETMVTPWASSRRTAEPVEVSLAAYR